MKFMAYFLVGWLIPSVGMASSGLATTPGLELFGIPFDFILFACTLIGVALFHHHTMKVALTGLSVIIIYKLIFTGFKHGTGVMGLALHFEHEWVILTNLLCLLLGFALLANHFEESKLPDILPKFLPSGWMGGFSLLALIFFMSAILDNIAAALIGGTIAGIVFHKKVHIGFLAAIVAASNAGGAGSVVGDTTTTMMWIAGISPLAVIHAFVGSFAALAIFGIPAAIMQHKYSPLTENAVTDIKIDWHRVGIVFFILISAISVNVLVNVAFADYSDSFPFLGATVWVCLILAALVRQPHWSLLPDAMKGSIFLLSLVVCASLMPVEKLPVASWFSAMMLGFISAVFDNIPLTALAIKQGGYDWGVLAYAVGFGGSMIWFGSSAGVAISNLFPEAKSVAAWVRHGWFVIVAYVIGFFVMLGLMGWHPTHTKVEIVAETPVHHVSEKEHDALREKN
ncbi:MAG: hypothetical protein H7832_14025 [Magnetococcus sp. DMHC-6]